ncbi:phthiocerol/phthiodiolone dimycocerosyl transferase family protein [Atopomonas hussainii]|uniref:phthiocerol/phthiodiolone dimycocerosyl transferase family protein n=1 Tax=Atopomonas hussainii TaxID=1429083 RepID=UPI000900259E|nr:hypothetical protein [Atopomonas hussainii]
MKRVLGALETRMALQHELHGTTQTTSAVRLRAPLTAAQLWRAVGCLFRRHALLRSRLQRSAAALWLSADALQNDIEVRCTQGAHLGVEALLSAAMADVLDPARALWRLHWHQLTGSDQHWLLLTCHHSIADARSLVQLLNELLQACQDSDGYAVQPAQPLPAPLERYQSAPPSSPVASSSHTCAWAHQRSCSLSQRRPALQRCVLAPAHVAALRGHAQSIGVSLNALLGAALLKAVGSVLGYWQVPLASAVDLRERVAQPVPRQQLGCYIGVAQSCLAAQRVPLAQLALRYQASLREQLPSLAPALPSLALAALRSRFAQWASQAQFSQGMAITNHGLIGLDAGRWAILDYANVAARTSGHFALALHVSQWQAQLSLCLVFTEPLLTQADAAQVLVAVQQQLNAALADTAEAS